MEESTENIKMLSMDRLRELGDKYISTLDRDKQMLGHRFVVSTGDSPTKLDGDLGFLQFVQKTLDAG